MQGHVRKEATETLRDFAQPDSVHELQGEKKMLLSEC